MITLSTRQPWAWLIVNGHKPVENRDWATNYRGRFLVHAGKTMAKSYYREVADWALANHVVLPPFEALERGGIVGRADLVDCVTSHPSPYFRGPHAFVLANAETLPFHACNGSLGFFDVKLP